jgi:sporulation protein YlmC with PRC-barrel domain
MVSLSDLRKMQVISSDGKLIGVVEDVTLTKKWKITGYTVRVDDAVGRSLGKSTHMFSALRLDVAVDQIKSFGDKMVLAKPVQELGKHLQTHEGGYRISNFINMQVVGTGGKVLGQVQDIYLENYSRKIPSLMVSVNGEVMDHLKMKKPFLGKGALTLSMTHVKCIKDFVMLNTDRDALARMMASSTSEKG